MAPSSDSSVLASSDSMPLVPEHIRRLVPYPPGKPLSELERELGITHAVKLASNENALGPSPRAVEAMQAALATVHRYPDGGAWFLRHALATHLDVAPERLLLGNGSNELIEHLIRAFGGPERGVLASECTFVVYALIAQAAGVPVTTVPTQDFHFDLEAMAAAWHPGIRLVFLCSPNNPTGTVIAPAALERFMGRISDETIVVLDEAYLEYCDPSERLDALRWVAERPRTVTLRTFSKAYGLAGVRVGYGVTSAELADYVNRVRQPFNVNTLAQVAAEAALADVAFLDEVFRVTRHGRQQVLDGLAHLGLRTIPSQANFVMFDLARDGRAVYDALLRLGVIVRPLANYGLPTWLRVNMGTLDENARFLAALRQVLA